MNDKAEIGILSSLHADSGQVFYLLLVWGKVLTLF